MGSSGGNKAQDAANQQEQERQAKIAASTSQINQIFNDPSRQAEYDKLAADTTAYYTGDVNRQKGVADRKLKFALARMGQGGSSQQAYQGKVLGQDYNKALTTATRQGLQAGSGLRQSDEQSRASLIALAQTGLDTTTAAQDSTRALQSNLLSGQSQANVAQLGDAFGDLGSIFNTADQARASKQGMVYGYGGLYQPMYGVNNQGGVAGGYPGYGG